MSRSINGAQALDRLDGALADLRAAVGDAIDETDAARVHQAQVRADQVEQTRALAEHRLDVVRDAEDAAELDRLHTDARKLLQEHARFIERESAALDTAAERVMRLEGERADLARRHEEAIDAYESRVAEVEARLADDIAYEALVSDHDAALAMVERAHHKTELAQADRARKGEPYESDPLFSYLWTRRFRTPDYEAGPLTRMLDGWVARVCGYDAAYLNYARLTELPVRLAEHVERLTARAEVAHEALEAAETAALEAAGAEALRGDADALAEAIEATDGEIEEAEGEHLALAERVEKALAADEGPAKRARDLLERGLAAMSVPDLRVLAAETPSQDDDAIVDALVQLRLQDMSADAEADESRERAARLREDLAEAEELRRRFKRARLDSPYARFRQAAFDEIVRGVGATAMSAERALALLRRSVRRTAPRTDPGFGGRRRARTLGLPDIVADVLWEAAKHAGSGGPPGTFGGRSTGRPTSRSRPRVRRAPRRRGGFRTGGGF